jgi:predicted component of type VI protein secretion system
MAKVVLQFEGRVLKTCPLAAGMTVGRLPDNTVVIDNPAVSGRHARIVSAGDQFIVEDLDSRNGTFVNDARVTRHVLQHGDVIVVGKHSLSFDAASGEAVATAPETAPLMPDFGGTVVLDTVQQRKLLAAVEAQLRARAAKSDPAAAAEPPAAPAVGVLRVLGGRAERMEYTLAETSTIGKSDTALVRLRGWFKPAEAVSIARLGEGYVVTVVRGKILVNGQRLRGRRGLVHGDVLEVGGLTLEFRAKGSIAA